MKQHPLAVGIAFALCLSSATPLRADVVKAGGGSYRTTRPEPCQPLPERIYRTTDVTGPMVTGQWWSSLVWQPFSQALFAHPLALRCSENGLEVTYPGSSITANQHGIFGLGLPKGGDLTIGHAGADPFEQAECGGYSDWFVTAVFETDSSSLKTTFGHGSPFVFCENTGSNATILFPRPPEIWSGSNGDSTLGVTINGHHYGLFGPTGSAGVGLDTRQLTNDTNGKGYFSVAILPDKEVATLGRFKKYAHNQVTDTRVTHTVVKGQVTTNYDFVTAPLEGDADGTLFALYPHQWKHAVSELTDTTYGSVRGEMRVGEGPGFKTAVPVQGVLPFLPRAGIANRERMVGYLKSEADKKQRGFADTYWEGKHLGKLATLSGVAEAAREPELQQVFVNEMKRRLEEWFTAAPDKQQPVFYYDSNWGTLIGSKPSYGSDHPLNDHHFHYGYFIRAAAFMDANPNCKLEGGNTHAFMHHWIHTLKNLGMNDPGVTADHPLVSVFVKDGKRTYAAYHFADEPVAVNFSDGKRLVAQPRALTVEPAKERLSEAPHRDPLNAP